MDKIYDAEFAESSDRLESYADFVAVVRQLRRDCPWDREQTHASVKHLLIEEAYEAAEAIDNEDWDELKRELGDLLLHVVFHSVIGEGEDSFTLQEVIETEKDKLIQRHPHVFGDADVENVDEVLQNWEKIKQNEKNGTSVLAGVPRQLPALLRAHRMQEKAAGVGFDFPTAEEAWQKVEEELQEFRETLAGDGGLTEDDAADAAQADAQEAEFGDVLFALVNYARLDGLTPENALQRTNNEFARRFAHIERRLEEQDTTFADVDLETMDMYWVEAKQ